MKNKNIWYTTLCTVLIIVNAVESGPLLRLALLLSGGLLALSIVREIKDRRK